MRSQESNYMYSSFTKSTIKNQNTQLTEKSVGITIRMFPDYPIEKSQYPINKKISGYYPIHQNFLSGALYQLVPHCEKRSLIPIIGQAAGWLFGLVTEQDISDTSKNIKNLASNQQHILHVVQESISILNMSRIEIIHVINFKEESGRFSFISWGFLKNV